MSCIKTLAMFRKLYDERFDNLVIYSVGMGVPYEHAKDIVQECFIRLWENHEKVATPVSYLFTAVRNSSINWLKADARRKMVSMENLKHSHADDFSIEESIEYFHKLEEAYRRLQELTGRCRDIFSMVYVEKMKVKEVASELDLSENTVKTYLKRAKEALRLLCASVAIMLPVLFL